jgi:hypothetical protein
VGRLAALLIVAVTLGAGGAMLAGFGRGGPKPRGASELPHGASLGVRHGVRHAKRPPQFVVVSFDGSGGVQLWPYWRWIARRAHAHFTFFVSGVYLLDEARSRLYHPPRHLPGRSDIGFAQAEGEVPARAVVLGMLQQMTIAYRAGHEIASHFNGHFCAPYAGNVGTWSAADWRQELNEFDKLVFHASENNRLRPRLRLPFGPSEIVGERTPCLQGNLPVLYRVLARRGFRYDASKVAVLGDWPRRELGLWSAPLLEVPFVGHTYRVFTMDYNFYANQTSAHEAPLADSRRIGREVYNTIWRAFRTSYHGNRAPLPLGYHFETWNHWAYDHALARFLVKACRMPEVRCVSYRELVDWLDKQQASALRRYRAGGFPHLRRR